MSLNYSLQQLMGHNPQKLTIKGMKSLHFQIGLTYLELKKYKEFIHDVVHDERCFDIHLFKKLLKLFKKYDLGAEEEFQQLTSLSEELETKSKEKGLLIRL